MQFLALEKEQINLPSPLPLGWHRWG